MDQSLSNGIESSCLVNTAIISPSRSNAGVGFAIGIDILNRALPQLTWPYQNVRLLPRLPSRCLHRGLC
jgi:hypothetical protein